MDLLPENSSNLEALREDYKHELITLHATLKKLDRDLDFSAILNPLLAETGPAAAHLQKLSRQIVRMKSAMEKEVEKANSLRQSPAQTSGGSAATPVPHAAAIAAPCSGWRESRDIVPEEILPS